MTACFLREGSDALDAAIEFSSIAGACRSFMMSAEELAEYGQAHSATIHIAKTRDEIAEYPDYVLELGPRGGLRKEKA